MIWSMSVLQQNFFIKKISKVGASYAFFLPLDWVNVYCDKIEGKYWVELTQRGKNITISALTEGDIERVSSMVKDIREQKPKD